MSAPQFKKPSPVKTFNATARVFFREIRKIFSKDATMDFLAGQLDKYAKNQVASHVPALQFYKAMNTKTGIPSETGEAVVGEMVLNHDARLFSKDCTASIPQLDAIDFRNKWGLLTQENREFVWGYLERMAKLSAEAAATKAMGQEDIMRMVGAMGRVAESVVPGTSDSDKAKALLADPEISKITDNVISRMEDMCKTKLQ